MDKWKPKSPEQLYKRLDEHFKVSDGLYTVYDKLHFIEDKDTVVKKWETMRSHNPFGRISVGKIKLNWNLLATSFINSIFPDPKITYKEKEPTMKPGGGSVLFWRCFTAPGTGCPEQGTMKSEASWDFLEPRKLCLTGNGSNRMMTQNTPLPTSEVDFKPWSIERLWKKLKCAVCRRNSWGVGWNICRLGCRLSQKSIHTTFDGFYLKWVQYLTKKPFFLKSDASKHISPKNFQTKIFFRSSRGKNVESLKSEGRNGVMRKSCLIYIMLLHLGLLKIIWSMTSDKQYTLAPSVSCCCCQISFAGWNLWSFS